MFRSIRWSLLFWYALTLSAVVGGFGATLYYKLRSSLYREVDSEVRAHAVALAGSLKSEKGGPFDLEISDEYIRYFRQDEDDAPYYVIWDGAGRVVDQSNPRLKLGRPEGARPPYNRGHRREVVVKGPVESLVLVGKHVGEARGRLRELLGAVLAAGAAVTILALAGGWFLAWRALSPIERISRAASAISASNLSQRIDVAQTENELGRLAQTLNEAFDRLEKAFERQTRFTADSSHELRTPLSIAMSQAELALRKERSPGEYREALEAVLRASQRMKAVVEGLLTLARADARELNLQKDRINLQKIVEETAAMLGPLAIERKVSLTVSAEPVEVEGDRDRLREVVTNLITNAVRYNREGGKVDVTLQAEKDQAVLAVVDTGIGIPERDQPHIFERFYRVDKARSREQGGSGLGLAIAKWIIEAHGGSITFVSREDHGATFTVRLARAD